MVPSPPELVSDCSRCVGLCCVALAFSRSADFGFDKAAGEPCRHLGDDAGCGIHAQLRPRGFAGCTVFECFGAGQQVVQVTYGGDLDVRSPAGAGGRADEAFSVFAVLRQLHEMLVLLDEAERLGGAKFEQERVVLWQICEAAPAAILAADVEALRSQVGAVLRRVSRQLRGSAGIDLAGADLMGQDLRAYDVRRGDLRGALLVAADLRELDLSGTDLLGADLRDTDVRGADLSGALFLTRPQLAAARGDSATRLPEGLDRPSHW